MHPANFHLHIMAKNMILVPLILILMEDFGVRQKWTNLEITRREIGVIVPENVTMK